MAKKPGASTKFTGLRRQAEERLRATSREVAAMPVEDVQQLVHELQVHQVELEMQNEELRRAQLELEAARDRYVDLYDSAPTGYLTLDAKGTILGANLPACALLGVPRKDLLGQSAMPFVTAKDQAAFLRHLRELAATGMGQVCEVDLARQDGVSRSVRFESVAVQDEARRGSHVLTALMDITERLRAEAALRGSQQRLAHQQQRGEREEIGHDLHDGILQSLYAVGLGLEAGKDCISEAPDKAAAALTHGIGELNFVMQEVRRFIGGLEGEGLAAIDLPGSLRTMAETLARLHGRQVRVFIDQAAASKISPLHSLQILNLVKEALSNSFRHGRATLAQVSLRRLQKGLRVMVRDNGKGLRRENAPGDGHGFVSMAARANRLGGLLAVQSKPGKGTRVVLDLPRKYNMDEEKP